MGNPYVKMRTSPNWLHSGSIAVGSHILPIQLVWIGFGPVRTGFLFFSYHWKTINFISVLGPQRFLEPVSSGRSFCPLMKESARTARKNQRCTIHLEPNQPVQATKNSSNTFGSRKIIQPPKRRGQPKIRDKISKFARSESLKCKEPTRTSLELVS